MDVYVVFAGAPEGAKAVLVFVGGVASEAVLFAASAAPTENHRVFSPM
ncbi:hypothetical protein [Thauera sp.]|jgi:phage gp45-like|nr:hypothetical protein [Thauera sp.]